MTVEMYCPDCTQPMRRGHDESGEWYYCENCNRSMPIEKREIQELPLEVRICILRRIITDNNAKECALIEESRQCRDELLKLGVEAFPPFPNDEKAESDKVKK
jgi:DNA-directed RNA polymerase subunit M/transcription elongation factor TFIIS